MKVSPRSHHETRSNKRQRIDQGVPPLASLATIPNDCLLAVLLWLEADDLNSLSICNKRMRDARCHASLDQTRIGTVIFHPESATTVRTLYDRIVNDGWNQAFHSTRNQTHLRIVNIDNLKKSSIVQLRKQIKKENIRLTGVTHLDLSGDYVYGSLTSGRMVHMALSLLMPNLVSLDLSCYMSIHFNSLIDWSKNCPSLQSITCAGMENLCSDGIHFRSFPNLRELNLPQADFYHYKCAVIFSHCRHLERLDIRGATWTFVGMPNMNCPFSVEMVTKFLSSSSTMKWLACDLSFADKNGLENKFPRVTFVT